MKKFGLLIFLYLYITDIQAGQFRFKHLGIDEGMTQNTVFAVLQDKAGFMWFGTKDGLNRYDGKRFRYFKKDNTPHSLRNNMVNVLWEDRDGKIWVGTDAGISILDPRTEYFTDFAVKTADQQAVTGKVLDIRTDQRGDIWIVDLLGGVFIFHPEDQKLSSLKFNDGTTVGGVVEVCMDVQGNVWLATAWQGLNCYDGKTGEVQRFAGSYPFKELNMACLLDRNEYLYIGTGNRGLLRLNKETGEVVSILAKDHLNRNLYIHALLQDADKNIWIGGETGLYIYDASSYEITPVLQSYVDRFTLSDNAIYSFCQDREGGIWIGTYFGGVNYYPPQYTPFDNHYPLADGKTISGKNVREFQEDKQGNIWIGTEDAGLNCFNPRTGEFKYFVADGGINSLSYHNIHGLQIDGDELWVGTFNGGLNRLDIKTGKIKHYPHHTGRNAPPNDIYATCKDRKGKVWFGSFDGAYFWRSQTDDFEKLHQIGSHFIYDICEDYHGNLWFAAAAYGAIRYNPETGDLTVFKNSATDSLGLGMSSITGIFEDSQKRLWLSTEGDGIYRFNEEAGTFTNYSVDEGLPNNVVYYITEDQEGYLWFGTNAGLVRFQPETEKVKIFTRQNGLLCNQFNYKSAFRAQDGTLYFGVINGFISFHPEELKEPAHVAPLLLTSFQIFNQEVAIGEKSPLKEAIPFTKEVKLRYDQNTLSFDFATLNYSAPEMNRYRYQLEGLDEDWHTLGENQKISYANLAPGRYSLLIEPEQEKEINGCRLDILIIPPFWQTYYAWIFYVLLFGGIIYGLIRRANCRVRERNRVRMELFEKEKEKEMYHAKIEFFTNIAHEIRTPLTLIKGPLERILIEKRYHAEIQEELNMMFRNTDRLLALINQLLDFRKLEHNTVGVSFIHADISSLVRTVYADFLPTFEGYRLKVLLDIPGEVIEADVDVEMVTKIISNLFSNAGKFAVTSIAIQLRKGDNGQMCLIVENDGELIPEGLAEKIFEPFFRMEQGNHQKLSGTGLGLPLARTLAEFHHGRLYWKQSETRRNLFVLELPLQQQNTLQIEKVPEFIPQEREKIQVECKEKYTILVTEDHAEMLGFLSRQLEEQYQVVTAGNGKQALEILDQEHVDLIISDIMMPVMDGLELLGIIKSDLKYSHIPVILLTAKTDLQTKMNSLGLGADAYIEKPFSSEYLLLQVANLLESRQKLRESFMKSPYLCSGTITLTKADEEYMARINEMIEKNLENTDFTVDELAEVMNTSRSSLLRKVKGISGMTVNEYIRLIRLKKAVQLLEEGKYRINEICFLTGFNSASYFAKCFQKQFGVLPKDFNTNRKGSL